MQSFQIYSSRNDIIQAAASYKNRNFVGERDVVMGVTAFGISGFKPNLEDQPSASHSAPNDIDPKKRPDEHG